MAKRKETGHASHDAVTHELTGSNSDEALKGFVERFAQIQIKKQKLIRPLIDDEKLTLTEAKGAGFSKMAIRQAVKEMLMTPEQRDAHNEVDEQRRKITELCRDLPLFGASPDDFDPIAEAA